ncbi:MAG: hypothetical protein HUN04_07020 [Desulfobacter sp.]|nr:MAG: hypothetical protein HUN04_07020 [Desulfobacter sp.]
MMKKISLWLRPISIPFALVILALALSGYPVLSIRDTRASGTTGMPAQGNTLEAVFYVT